MTNQIHKYIVLITGGLTALLPLIGFSDPAAESLDGKFLKEALLNVEPWPNRLSTNYSEASWEQLCYIAEMFQKSDSQTVSNALSQYQGPREDVSSMEEVKNDSKLLLLLRVVFDLPERSPDNGKWPSFSSWWTTERTEYNIDGTLNHAWPIVWNDGSPYLVTGFIGIEGFRRYSAAGEFVYFKKKYPFRDLSSLKYGKKK